MSIVNSRLSLKEHCLRSLGKPLINIEIADSQIDDIIDDVIALYQERVYDGTSEHFLKYQITQTDIDNAKTLVLDNNLSPYQSNNNFIVLPEYITTVHEVLTLSKTSVGDMFQRSAEFFARENILYNNSVVQFDLISIPLATEYIGALNYLTKPETRTRFSYNTGRLYLDQDIKSMLNCFIVIRCTKWNDPDQFTRMWGNRFIRELTTIKMKLCWGGNLMKFSDISLPSGIKYNADKIYNSAKDELDIFMSKMAADWELMPTMLIG
jgi:hypothetical protein